MLPTSQLSRAADLATEAENAVNLLRSEEVLLNYLPLKNFAKTRQAEQHLLNCGQTQNYNE